MTLQYEPPQFDSLIRAALIASPDVVNMVGGTAAPRIYGGMAPQGATYPLIVYTELVGGPLNMTQTPEEQHIYSVGAWAQGGTSYTQAGDLFAAVQESLHNYDFSLSGWNTFWFALESASVKRFTETSNSIIYNRKQGEFRLMTSME